MAARILHRVLTALTAAALGVTVPAASATAAPSAVAAPGAPAAHSRPAVAAPGAATPTAASVDMHQFDTTRSTVGAGAFTKIYDPSVGEPQPWYINDHTIIRGRDGTWHLFGITHPEPADPSDEVNFAHATAPTVHGPWTKQPFALTVDPGYGETHLWAPYVLRAHGRYYMFYAGGGADSTRSEINLATSPDLYHWTRWPGGPLFRDGFEARDPMVTRVGDQWVMYYCATDNPAGGHHVVAYRTSSDLTHWSARHIAYTSPDTGTGGGNTESPFVQRHQGRYYLFIGPCGAYAGSNAYNCTDVFASHDPYRFTDAGHVGRIAAHAAEVVQDTDGSWWISHSGWGQGGVYLAPLHWNQPERISGVTVRTADYRATLQTSPVTELTELAAPAGSGRWHNLLDTAFRGTVAYAGIGGFGDTDRPGPSAHVTADPSTGQVDVTGVPVGDELVTVDETLHFTPAWFDTSYRWHVTGPLSAPAWEAGWSLDTTLPRVGDDANPARGIGDVHGFPRWTIATGPGATLVAAYKAHSAWAEANHWFEPDVGEIAWQPLWVPGGTGWAPGDYAGGTWRLGLSPHPDDTGLADALYTGLNGAG